MHHPRLGWLVFGLGLAVWGCGKTHHVGGDPSVLSGQSGESGESGAGVIAGSAGTPAVPTGGSGGSGGAPTSGGAAGTGGSSRLPDDGVVPPPAALSKLDLLLMIDNSRGMREKQQILSDAVAWLLGQLSGSLDDIHVGVISSSLGAHGAQKEQDICKAAGNDDHARLLGSQRPGLVTWNDAGFLAWDPAQSATPPGLADPATFEDQTAQLLSSAGDTGCGFEASLEAWYRFLVDPEPPLSVAVPPGQSVATVSGIDEVLLAQRKAFLRPDSVLAIVVLSDENDCSAVDEGYGWLMFRAQDPMFGSTSACQTDPNAPCCQSCGEVTAHAGCVDPQDDAACAAGLTLLPPEKDKVNLRCWDQKRRFGFDLLQPLTRYVDGLTRQHVLNRAGQPVANGLFAAGGATRHPSQVIYSGIVGVPWQDLANATSLTGTGLAYLSTAELEQQGRWQLLLGDPEASPPVRPTDPFMLETPLDRSALASGSAHPLVPEQKLVPSTSTNPLANSINGHEQVDVDDSQLQLACTFPLVTPALCDEAARTLNQGCSCFAGSAPYNSPLCQPPAGGPVGLTQFYAGATPGTRHLQLMRKLGDTAVPASACPKSMDETSPDYGYRPAMRALLPRLESALNP